MAGGGRQAAGGVGTPGRIPRSSPGAWVGMRDLLGVAAKAEPDIRGRTRPEGSATVSENPQRASRGRRRCGGRVHSSQTKRNRVRHAPARPSRDSRVASRKRG